MDKVSSIVLISCPSLGTTDQEPRPNNKRNFEIEITVNCPSQETEGTTRHVENVALTTKGLQERKQN